MLTIVGLIPSRKLFGQSGLSNYETKSFIRDLKKALSLNHSFMIIRSWVEIEIPLRFGGKSSTQKNAQCS